MGTLLPPLRPPCEKKSRSQKVQAFFPPSLSLQTKRQRPFGRAKKVEGRGKGADRWLDMEDDAVCLCLCPSFFFSPKTDKFQRARRAYAGAGGSGAVFNPAQLESPVCPDLGTLSRPYDVPKCQIWTQHREGHHHIITIPSLPFPSFPGLLALLPSLPLSSWEPQHAAARKEEGICGQVLAYYILAVVHKDPKSGSTDFPFHQTEIFPPPPSLDPLLFLSGLQFLL